MLSRRTLLLSTPLAINLRPEQLSWIVDDLRSGKRHEQWPDVNHPVPMGSLLKPFVALAYGATNPKFPVVLCEGISSGCWNGRGHGAQRITEALANSCNAYFLKLAGGVNRAALEAICLSYGLRAPERGVAAEQLIGLEEAWPQSPRATVEAFGLLYKNRDWGCTRTVLAGMSLCATSGTARAVGMRCFAKTGTAPCRHVPREEGDGFVAVVFPFEEPRHVLLARHHNTTGAETARDALPILRKVGLSDLV